MARGVRSHWRLLGKQIRPFRLKRTSRAHDRIATSGPEPSQTARFTNRPFRAKSGHSRVASNGSIRSKTIVRSSRHEIRQWRIAECPPLAEGYAKRTFTNHTCKEVKNFKREGGGALSAARRSAGVGPSSCVGSSRSRCSRHRRGRGSPLGLASPKWGPDGMGWLRR
jgi:hypothetical protein